MLHVNGIAEEADMLLHRSSLTIGMIHCPFALHSQNTTSKIKFLNFQDGDSQAKNQVQNPVPTSQAHEADPTLLHLVSSGNGIKNSW